MKTEIRNMLIERARLNAPIMYGTIMQQLGLNNENSTDREVLSGILADISRAEYVDNRPLLSVMNEIIYYLKESLSKPIQTGRFYFKAIKPLFSFLNE